MVLVSVPRTSRSAHGSVKEAVCGLPMDVSVAPTPTPMLPASAGDAGAKSDMSDRESKDEDDQFHSHLCLLF